MSKSPLSFLKPFCIMAENHEEVKDFARRYQLTDHDYTYLHNRSVILSLRSPIVIKLDNWYRRKDAKELKSLLDSRNPKYIDEHEITQSFGN